jgi:DNA-directed RNA polymerase subunit RPC12/RpoP
VNCTYYVCGRCAHIETRLAQTEPPRRCENCGHRYVTQWDDLDGAEASSEAILRASRTDALVARSDANALDALKRALDR